MLGTLQGMAFKACCYMERSGDACLPDCGPEARPAQPEPSYKYLNNQVAEVKATFQGFLCLLLPVLYPYYLVHLDPDTVVL